MKSSVFIFYIHIFFVQSATVQESLDGEVEIMFTRNNLRRELAPDGHEVFPMFQFINIVEGYIMNDMYGKKKTSEMITEHKAELEDHGIYYMKNRHGPPTPAMNLNGLKGLLNYLTGEFAMKYKKYSIKTTTRVEAGDKSMHNVIDTNAVSSNILNKMARNALAQESVSGGSSIAVPPDQVLDLCAWFALVALDLTTEPFFVSLPQDAGVSDVMRAKRKLEQDEDLQFLQQKITLQERYFELKQKDFELKQNDFELKQKDFELQHKIKYADFELQQKIQYAEIEIQQKKNYAEVGLQQEKKYAGVALNEKKKYALQYGKLALQEKDVEVQEIQFALREKQFALREKEFKLSVEIKERNLAIHPVNGTINKQTDPKAKDRPPPRERQGLSGRNYEEATPPRERQALRHS
jgi:hypothetical protein